jgi:hypothetical protein
MLPKTLYKARITLVPKLDETVQLKRKAIDDMSYDLGWRILNKILGNLSQECGKLLYTTISELLF